MTQEAGRGTIQQPVDRMAILRRIDAIERELSELRRLVDRMLPPELSPLEEQHLQPPTLTSQLLGCLGTEPIEAYEYDLDWSRFVFR